MTRSIAMIALILAAVILAAIMPGVAAAQNSEGAPKTSSNKGTPASIPPTTLAPVAIGSSEMHRVPTPTEPPKTTMTGGNTNGGAN